MAETTYTLTPEQQNILRQKIEASKQDGHYGQAYKYLTEIIPHSNQIAGNDNAGLYTHNFGKWGSSNWFYTAYATNSQEGGFIDRMTDLALRHATQ